MPIRLSGTVGGGELQLDAARVSHPVGFSLLRRALVLSEPED